eukprot:2798506-Prymnesium_polylepis.1
MDQIADCRLQIGVGAQGSGGLKADCRLQIADCGAGLRDLNLPSDCRLQIAEVGLRAESRFCGQIADCRLWLCV